MLISSDRHTAADRHLWQEYEAADRVHTVPQRLLERTEREVRSFVSRGACYAGVSWGKDSVVLAHLLRTWKLPVPLFWWRHDWCECPETPLVRDAFLERPECRFACYREYRCSDLEHVTRSVREANKKHGSRRITGVRADESGTRKVSARIHGVSTKASCRPLLYWSGPDIFGYLAQHDLPVHPNYAMLGGGRWPRQHLRVHSFEGDRGVEFGRREWEAEYYGDVLRRIDASSDNGI